MEEYLILASVALFASLLTFFSGFGLGTLLTPAFMLFFPIDTAITLTGIVHLLNNIFKIGLIGKNINYRVLIRFGIPAIAGAYLGAQLLLDFTHLPVVHQYEMSGATFSIKLVNVLIALLMVAFALIEIVPRFKYAQFGSKALIPGGAISGFFGGLSGHQGALRSMFLMKSGIGKEGFIATGVAIACFVDLTRLGVYFSGEAIPNVQDNINILATATIAAFVGAFLGKRALKKVTMKTVQITVSFLVIILAIGLGFGVI